MMTPDQPLSTEAVHSKQLSDDDDPPPDLLPPDASVAPSFGLEDAPPRFLSVGGGFDAFAEAFLEDMTRQAEADLVHLVSMSLLLLTIKFRLTVLQSPPKLLPMLLLICMMLLMPRVIQESFEDGPLKMEQMMKSLLRIVPSLPLAASAGIMEL
jgi:hypothetical protein